MTVKLIAKTEPVLDIPPDGLIAYVARVSNPDNQNNYATGPKLLRYLKKHQHWSPFEMASATMEITTTRDIARQILRHRSFSFQEFSQRYSSDIELSAPRETRLQDPTNRQNSIDTDPNKWWLNEQENVAGMAIRAYYMALNAGIAKEVARSILPEGMTISKLYMAGNMRSWLHYVALRTGPETQKEHRLIAEECRAELVKYFPELFD